MKHVFDNILLFCATLIVVLACEPERAEKISDPIEFSVSSANFSSVYGEDELSGVLADGVNVGIFVGSTREMSYHVEQNKLIADEADIPQYYGTSAYAVVPATGDASLYTEAYLKIPSEQSLKDGVNPYLLSSFAFSEIENGHAGFEFKPMNAVVELGFTSADASIISALTIKAPNLEDGYYLCGNKKYEFSEYGFSLKEEIYNGGSTIKVSFPDNIVLSSEVTYVPVSVLPFMTEKGGLEVTLYNEKGYPYEIGAILTDNDDYCNGGALDVLAGEYIKKFVVDVRQDSFSVPAIVRLGVKENKTGNMMPEMKMNIYSLLGEQEVFVQTVETGEDGTTSLEMIPGKYKAYIVKSDGTDDKIRSVIFSVEPESSTEVELLYYSYTKEIFHDDFNWITPDMGEGDKILDYFIKTMDPPAINTGVQANSKIDVCDNGALEKIEEIGWDFYQPAPNGGSITWVYLRLGEIQLAKSKGYGQATTPPMSNLNEKSDVLLSIVADPFYSVKNNIPTSFPTQLKITIIGEGSFDSEKTVKEYCTDPIQSGDLSNPQEVPEGEPKTFGQKTYYDFLIYGADAQTKFCIMTYDETVDDPNSYSNRQILIDDVKVTKGE